MNMRRLSLLLALLLLAALTPKRAPTMALLDLSPRYEMQVDACGAMRGALQAALQRHGFDAFQTNIRYEDLRHADNANADYYLEILGSEREAYSRGGGGAGVGPVDVGVTAVMNRHFLEL